MSDRERWIVYPLLFLTLGIALRNQFLPTRRFGAVDLKAGEISAQKILCNDLVIMQKGECNQLQCEKLQFNESLGKHIVVVGLAECVQLKAGEAECRAMLVVNDQGKPVVLAASDKNTRSGIIQTMNAQGKPVVLAASDKNSQSGVIQTMNSIGMPQVQIRSTDSGGVVTTVGHGGKVLVAMGHEGQNFGVFAQFPQVGPPFPLTPAWRIDAKTVTPKPSQIPAPITTPQQGNPPSGGNTP